MGKSSFNDVGSRMIGSRMLQFLKYARSYGTDAT